MKECSDLREDQFEELERKIERIWMWRRKYVFRISGKFTSLEDHRRNIQDASDKLWWARSRSLSIAAMAQVDWLVNGNVRAGQYISEEEAAVLNEKLGRISQDQKSKGLDILKQLADHPHYCRQLQTFLKHTQWFTNDTTKTHNSDQQGFALLPPSLTGSVRSGL